MDHFNLKRLIFLLFLPLVGCVAHEPVQTAKSAITFFESKLSLKALLKLSEEYLQWHKGYPIQIRDENQGLLVTNWVSASPMERKRVTIKVTSQPYGSVLSSHIVKQALTPTGWREIPTMGQEEALLVREIQEILKTRTRPSPSPQSKLD